MTYTSGVCYTAGVVAIQRKLTLRLDEGPIQKARRISKKSGMSLSQMVADYFSLIEETDPEQRELTPRVRSLFGVLAGRKVSESDYERHLESKHR